MDDQSLDQLFIENGFESAGPSLVVDKQSGLEYERRVTAEAE